MDARNVFPSKYMKASDVLEHGTQTLKIKLFEVEEMSDGEVKPVIYFHNRKKGLVLNVTNNNGLINAFGYETDDWIGKTVVIEHGTTTYQGQRVGTMFVSELKPQAEEPKPEPAPVPAEQHEPVGEDDIPF